MREILGSRAVPGGAPRPAPGRHHDPRPHGQGAALLEGRALAVAARRRDRSERRLRRRARDRARADRPRRARGRPARAAPARLPDPRAPHGRGHRRALPALAQVPEPRAAGDHPARRRRRRRQDLARARGGPPARHRAGLLDRLRAPDHADHALARAGAGDPRLLLRRLPAVSRGFARRRPGGRGLPGAGGDRLGRDPRVGGPRDRREHQPGDGRRLDRAGHARRARPTPIART